MNRSVWPNVTSAAGKRRLRIYLKIFIANYIYYFHPLLPTVSPFSVSMKFFCYCVYVVKSDLVHRFVSEMGNLLDSDYLKN